ncbi:MAG TPA: Crp/Fnr family transcriptional regulator [Gammaproteobacteria bacterium]|nr:Crp/Fnr family transcriptional regulator [Gammaproteobacteria bacterium]
MLNKIPLFADLDDVEMEFLSRRAVTRTYSRNTIFITEGDYSDSLYCILSGRVKVFLNDAEGKEVILNVQGPGEYFGELALLDSGPRSASVMAMESCRLSVISKADFEDFLTKHDKAQKKIMLGMVKRLRALTENVRTLALLDVYGRVAHVLLQLARPQGDVLVIQEELRQQDIASRIGSSREMVSRVLKDLREGGYIEVDEHRHIIIKERLPSGW